jgi:signal transduction histidine kinase
MSYAGWLYLASLITFTFGAMTFSVLAANYWRERRTRRIPEGGRVFPAFTLVCAAAFLINLLFRGAMIAGAGQTVATALALALLLATGLVPPLIAHVIYSEERAGGGWRWLLAGLYVWSAGGSALYALSNAEVLPPGWGDRLDAVAPAALGCAAAAGLLLQGVSRRVLAPAERRHRLWKRGLLVLMMLSAAANLIYGEGVWSFLPDYLLLGFFCVTLYYTERLAFFDLFIKRGALFALCLAGLTLWFAVEPRALGALAEDWTRPWVAALLLTPFWLAVPWLYSRLTKAIDRAWLGRRYSGAEAERRFVQVIQAAADEADLLARAQASLSEIFKAPVEVRFEPGAARGGPLTADLEPEGCIVVSERPSGIPFLSDDRRLVQSLARTLGVVLENTRFREQRQRHEEREQELRWLASRAELKALRAQINPHFLFNALNAIAGLIPDQPRLAEQTVERLAEVFRYTLRKSEKEWVRLDEEIEFVTAYLEVEQARFGDRLRVEFDIAANAAAVQVPAMSVQPIVENAIKHGASERETGGTVGIRASLENGDTLCVEVFDNGPGFPAGFRLERAGGSHGLRNVRDRMHGYYGDAARLWWERSGDLTRVMLRIPCQPALEPAGKRHDDTRVDRG